MDRHAYEAFLRKLRVLDAFYANPSILVAALEYKVRSERGSHYTIVPTGFSILRADGHDEVYRTYPTTQVAYGFVDAPDISMPERTQSKPEEYEKLLKQARSKHKSSGTQKPKQFALFGQFGNTLSGIGVRGQIPLLDIAHLNLELAFGQSQIHSTMGISLGGSLDFDDLTFSLFDSVTIGFGAGGGALFALDGKQGWAAMPYYFLEGWGRIPKDQKPFIDIFVRIGAKNNAKNDYEDIIFSIGGVYYIL